MHSLKAEDDPIATAPLPIVLDRLGAELTELAATVDRLQDRLGPLLVDAAFQKPQAMVEIQSLDAIAQTLASLSDFVSDLGRCSHAGPSVAVGSLTERMTLSDLADRLCGTVSTASAEDFELF